MDGVTSGCPNTLLNYPPAISLVTLRICIICYISNGWIKLDRASSSDVGVDLGVWVHG